MNSEFTQGYSVLFSGMDEEEGRRQKNKQQRQAHPQYSQLNQKQKERKQKLINNQEEQAQEKQKIYETKPMFVSLVKPSNEEIQIDLEQYLDEEYSKEDKNVKIKYFAQENDFGQTEYKLRLFDPDSKRLTHLTTQMNFRLQEGNGTAHYKLGVEDSGHPLGLSKQDMLGSLRTLCTMASNLKAELLVVGIIPGIKGKIAEIIVRKGIKDGVNMDIRILMLGESGSGKTSLLGVLSSGQMDDGNGLARMKFLRNQSEIQSGKTERVSHTVIGFDSQGKIINHQNELNFSPDCMVEKIIDLSSKLITFIDMGGTKRAHNQMIQIVNSQFPDYALLTISAVSQITKFTMDYFKMIQLQQIPFMIVISHTDQVNMNELMEMLDQIKQIMKSLSIDSIPIVVRTEQDVVSFSKEILKKTLVPIFPISNLNQQTLDYFIKFLNLIPSTNELINNSNLPSEFCIHNVYEISQTQKILGGTVVKGIIRVGQILQLGPDKIGRFFPIEVDEIQCSRVKVKSSQCGQICTVSYKQTTHSVQIGTDQNPIRKGMVLIEGKTNPQAAWDFSAEIWLFDESSTIKKIQTSFEPVINTQYTRQICKIIKDPNEHFGKLKLEKKQSRSIDQFEIKYQEKDKKRNQYRKQSEQHFQKQFLEQNRSPRRRRKGSGQVAYENDEIQKESNKPDLFVINEKQDRICDYIELYANKPNLLRLKFKYLPEYITEGMKIIINEPNLQCWGFIKQIHY